MTSKYVFLIYVSLAICAAGVALLQPWFLALSVPALAASLDVFRTHRDETAGINNRLNDLEKASKKLAEDTQRANNQLAMFTGVRK